MDVNELLARRLKELREERALSIEHLADRSGVSRAMISVIERAQSSPTLTVLNKLSNGLGVLLPELFGDRGYRAPRLRLRHPVSSRSNQPECGDEAAGYRRRTLTPEGTEHPLRLSELVLRGGSRATAASRVALDGSGLRGSCRQIWMLEGELSLRVGTDLIELQAGDCVAIAGEHPLQLSNAGRREARCLLAVASTARPVRNGRGGLSPAAARSGSRR